MKNELEWKKVGELNPGDEFVLSIADDNLRRVGLIFDDGNACTVDQYGEEHTFDAEQMVYRAIKGKERQS
jgi:hypothetical protein